MQTSIPTARPSRHIGQRPLPLLFALSVLLSGCLTSIGPTISERGADELGPYPENYREIVRQWIEHSLPGISAIESLRISKPRPGSARPLLGLRRYGWMTQARFRAKDLMGLSKGRISWALLIREGKVVARQKRLD